MLVFANRLKIMAKSNLLNCMAALVEISNKTCQHTNVVSPQELKRSVPVQVMMFVGVVPQVYKSASKRKAHILKNHPGAELPPSIRKLRPAGPGEPDPMLSTHTQLTGTIATAPVCCPHCAKQYSSKVSGSTQHFPSSHREI